MDSKNKLFAAIGAVALVAAAAVGGNAIFGGKEQSTPSTATQTSVSSQVATDQTAPTTTTDTTSTPTSSSSGSSAKDGSYTATASYTVPHGDVNSIKVSLALSGGKVTSVTTSNTYGDGESARYIDSFQSSIQSAAVGQPLSGLSLSRVGGASLTTEAFDQAIQTIMTQAGA